MFWLAIGLFVLMLGVGIHFIFRAHQIYNARRMEYVTDWSGRCLKNPESIANRIALAKFCAGLGFVLMPFFILLTGLPFGAWQFPIAVIAGIYAIALNAIVMRHAKKSL